jgi:hypothetical protein
MFSSKEIEGQEINITRRSHGWTSERKMIISFTEYRPTWLDRNAHDVEIVDYH